MVTDKRAVLRSFFKSLCKMSFSSRTWKLFWLALNEKPEREGVQKENVSLEVISFGVCSEKNLSFIY